MNTQMESNGKGRETEWAWEPHGRHTTAHYEEADDSEYGRELITSPLGDANIFTLASVSGFPCQCITVAFSRPKRQSFYSISGSFRGDLCALPVTSPSAF